MALLYLWSSIVHQHVVGTTLLDVALATFATYYYVVSGHTTLDVATALTSLALVDHTLRFPLLFMLLPPSDFNRIVEAHVSTTRIPYALQCAKHTGAQRSSSSKDDASHDDDG